MAIQTTERGDTLLHLHELSDPSGLKLDVTTDVWLLKDGEVSDKVGLDVVNPNRYRPEVGRKGANVTAVSTALVKAFPGLSESDVDVRLTYVHRIEAPVGGSNQSNTYTDEVVADTGDITATAHGITDFHTNDRVAIHNPATHRGVYTINAIVDANTIRINNTANPGNGTLIDWLYFNHRDSIRVFEAGDTYYIVKSPQMLANDGIWPSYVVDKRISFDEDERDEAESGNTISAVTDLFGETDNAIALKLPLPAADLSEFSKISIVSCVNADLRGLWATDGRKFWILQSGTWNLKFDLGTAVDAGTEWEMSRIALDRFMITSNKYPPRIIKLNAETNPGVAGPESLAGCITPTKPGTEDITFGSSNVPSWGARDDINAGDLTGSGIYRVQVRAINTIENLESEFVDVHWDGQASFEGTTTEVIETQSTTRTAMPSNDKLLNIRSDGAQIYVYPAQKDYFGTFGPISSERWTHIEVWRTQDSGLVYFLESLIALNQREVGVLPAAFTENESNICLGNITASSAPVSTADSLTSGFTTKTTNDELAGRLPPICKQAVSLDGITFCFGRADTANMENMVTVYSQSYESVSGDSQTTADEYHDGDDAFDGYRWQSGDLLSIYDGGIDANGDEGVPADYTIEGVVGHQDVLSATGFDGINNLADDGTASDQTDVFQDMTDRNIATAVRQLDQNSQSVRIDFPSLPLVNERFRFWARNTSGTNANVDLVAYTDADSVTSTDKVTVSVPSNTDYDLYTVTLTQLLIDQLGTQSHGGVAFRLECNTATPTVLLSQVLPMVGPTSTRLTMESGFQTAFGTVTNDYRPPRAVIKRPFSIDWPFIQDDEAVFYSRTDKNAPESFFETPLILSRRGDVFRKAIVMGGMIAVIMDQGVHIIYLNSLGLPVVDTVSTEGDGTLWDDSIVSISRLVLWANNKGVHVLRATSDPNIEGERGTISLLGGDRFRSWFEEVVDAGATIDAGGDTFNGCVRFRRSDQQKTLQYSYRTDQFTFLEGDTGFTYSGGLSAVSGDSGVRLYSLTSQGTLFEVNRSGGYSGTVNHVMLAADSSTSTSITLDSGSFDTDLVGDAFWFTILGVWAGPLMITSITSLGHANDTLNWTPAFAPISEGQSFALSPIRFLVRYAPFRGKLSSSILTLEDMMLRAVEPTLTTANIGVSIYQDIPNTSPNTTTGTVGMFNPGASLKTSLDRVTDVANSGNNLELEISQYEAAAFFAIEALQVKVREEISDEFADRTT